jgi:hypothetical protein
MEWEHYEELGFIMSDEEDERPEATIVAKFLDKMPD